MRRRGHPILGAIAGLVFGVFLALALVVFGVIALDNVVIVVLPPLLLVLGIAWGLWAPLGRSRTAPPAA